MRKCCSYNFFFFSSRRRHTRWTGDWSSDVCSSDLDYFDQGRGEYQVVVRSDDGRVTTLILPNVPDVLEIGMSVIAEGRVSTDGVSLEASSITVLALPELPARDLAQSPI